MAQKLCSGKSAYRFSSEFKQFYMVLIQLVNIDVTVAANINILMTIEDRRLVVSVVKI